jgi:hypothetical protein
MYSFVNRPPVFHPDRFVGKIEGATALLAEPSLYSCSPVAMENYGGPLIRSALAQIRERYEHPIRRATNEGLSAICDVRVHRLFPGQYPAIPGWHCDAVPRGAYSGQPNFSLVHPFAFHVCLLLSSELKGVSNTEYVSQPMSPQLWDQEHVYRNIHQEVDRIKPQTATAQDGQFVWFDQRTIHRAKPAHARGVRLFLRYSMIEKPVLANKLNNNVQIYQLAEESGW